MYPSLETGFRLVSGVAHATGESGEVCLEHRKMNRREFDKRWWYQHAARNSGWPIVQARARELYPDMFYSDGRLCEPNMVAFGQDTRRRVPARQSPAYA